VFVRARLVGSQPVLRALRVKKRQNIISSRVSPATPDITPVPMKLLRFAFTGPLRQVPDYKGAAGRSRGSRDKTRQGSNNVGKFAKCLGTRSLWIVRTSDVIN